MIHSIQWNKMPCIEIIMGEADLDITVHAFEPIVGGGVGISFARSLGPNEVTNPNPLVLITMHTVRSIEALEIALNDAKQHLISEGH
jgi:hypothetical protein